MYSFGDSTTFPLRENFLDTLMATVRASAALFRCECRQSNATLHIREAGKAADLELAKLIGFQNALVSALKSAQGEASVQAAQVLTQAAAKVLGETRHRVTAERDQLIAQAEPKNMGAQIHKILNRFWISNQLPHTRWTFHWRQNAEGKMRADLRATAKAITADFRTELSQSDVWGAPISVASLMPGIDITVPIWTRKSKGTETNIESLDAYEIIEMESSLSRHRLVLRRTGKAKHSLMITLMDDGQSSPTMVLVDEENSIAGDTHVLLSDDAKRMGKLWSLLKEERSTLVQSRSSLGEVSIGNRQLRTISHPSEVAEFLLTAVAPLTREIRLRSRVPGELILKRNIGQGRREEIFMSRDDLQEQYQDLPDDFRRVFDAMGLGSESTCDFVTMLGSESRSEERGRSQRSKADKPRSRSSLDAELDSVLLDIEAA